MEDVKNIVVAVRDEVTSLAQEIEALKAREGNASEIDAKTNKLIERVEEMEAKSNTPGGGNGNADSGSDITDMIGLIRGSLKSSDLVTRAVNNPVTRQFVTDDNPQGGFLAPNEWSAELIRVMDEMSPVRAYANVRPTNAPAVSVPILEATQAARWGKEGASGGSTATDDPVKEVTIPLERMESQVAISDLMGLASNYPIEETIRNDMADEFARAEGEAFCSGNGVTRPTGFITKVKDTAAQVVNSGAAATLGDDLTKIKSLLTKVKDRYRMRGRFFMNYTTWDTITSMVDGNSRPLVDPGRVSDGVPQRLFGYEVVILPDMPDIEAGAYPIAFGDMRFYRIYDLTGTLMIRNPFSSMPNIILYGYRWVGGAPLLDEAFALLKVSA